MTQENLEAEFQTLTTAQQSEINGGDFASTVGWFAGYAAGCVVDACAIASRVASGGTPVYAPGYGWF